VLDIPFLGRAQINRNGNVNVSKFNDVVSGCGGFIDITYRAKKLVLCGTFMAGGLDIDVIDSRLRINRDGKFSNFVTDVEQIILSAKNSLASGQQVLYVTERAVFKLEDNGLYQIEIAEGIDMEKDIKAHIPFDIVVDPTLKLMGKAYFLP
jgi:propionate CoA-transferase